MHETTQSTAEQPVRMNRRIGSTTFRVAVFFSQRSKETVDDKILRLIERDATVQDPPQICHTAGKRLS